MAKTRTTKSSARSSTEDAAKETTKSSVQKTQLRPDSSNPPQIFILPENSSAEARIVTLENPRYCTDSRYLLCPEKGFFEFTRIAAPKSTPRSWLLSAKDGGQAEEGKGDKDLKGESQENEDDFSKGYVTKTANMFIATPVDPLFLLLTSLSPKPVVKASELEKKLFLSGEDYIDRITAVSPQLKALLRTESLRKRLETRMTAVCDTVDAGDEVMYRINDIKLLKELWSKAQNMAKSGLPESMENKFIRKALEVPMLSVKRDESFLQDLREGEEEAKSVISTPVTESAESQTSASTAATSFTEASTAATSFSSENEGTDGKKQTEVPKQPTITAPEGIPALLRLRTAFNFLLSSYVPPYLHLPLATLLSSPSTSPADFTPLDAHLAHLAKLRQDAIAARSLNDMSRKRAFDDEEEEVRAEKRRKKEEEEKKKKAGESRGVKNLKKVNVTGMKKMSDFFKKKA